MKARFDIDLYPVTCEAFSEGRTDMEILEAVAAGGGRVIQLREKEWSRRRLYECALEMRQITRRYGMLLLVNDHVDLALAVGADGVHLGRSDLPVAAARRIAPELIIGASSHSLEQALEAQAAGASYVNIGPIFPTGTKPGVVALGPEAIGRIAPSLEIPFTVMGGINRGNLDQVLAQGARRIAMISGVTRAPDVTERVRELRARILAAGNP